MTTVDYMLGGLALLLLAAASPLIYEQATSETPRVDEAYWAERGLPPLDASSTGEAAPEEEADEPWKGAGDE